MTPAPGDNARLVGQVMAFSGVFVLAPALAMIFAVTGFADLIIAFVFMTRHRP